MYDNFLFIGATGEGKTSLLKQIIGHTNIFVFDVNNEWLDCDFDTRKKKSRFIGDYEDFLTLCLSRKNTNCVFEDATGFVSSNIVKSFNRTMVAKRHNRNNYFFLFHSIADVPPSVFRKMDYVILFRTGDEDKIVEKRYPKLWPAFQKIKNTPPTPKDEGKKIVIQPHIKIKMM